MKDSLILHLERTDKKGFQLSLVPLGGFLARKAAWIGVAESRTKPEAFLGILHKEDASTKLPLLLCERNESNH